MLQVGEVLMFVLMIQGMQSQLITWLDHAFYSIVPILSSLGVSRNFTNAHG